MTNQVNKNSNNQHPFYKSLILSLVIFGSLVVVTSIGLAKRTIQTFDDPSFCHSELYQNEGEVKNVVDTLWSESFSDISSMSKAAEFVIVGKVMSVERGRTIIASSGVSKIPYYNVSVSIEKVLTPQGLRTPNLEEKEVLLEQLGDPEDTTTVWIEAPIFKSGDRYLLFLKKKDDPRYFRLISPQGRFLLTNGIACPVSEHPSWEIFSGKEENKLIQETINSLH
jgi:hypothetical protein